jgi:hypothetical protein
VALRLTVLFGSAVALAAAGEGGLAIAFAAMIAADELALVALGKPVAGAP